VIPPRRRAASDRQAAAITATGTITLPQALF
jgi:hypothetical protein